MATTTRPTSPIAGSTLELRLLHPAFGDKFIVVRAGLSPLQEALRHEAWVTQANIERAERLAKEAGEAIPTRPKEYWTAESTYYALLCVPGKDGTNITQSLVEPGVEIPQDASSTKFWDHMPELVRRGVQRFYNLKVNEGVGHLGGEDFISALELFSRESSPSAPSSPGSSENGKKRGGGSSPD
jgi:hypothetical protein